MSTSPDRVAELLQAVADWGRAQPDVLAIALVGSYAREAAGPDSDVDLVIISSHPEQYLSDFHWMDRFGEVERYQTEDYGKVTSVRVWYGDGLEVEYGITNAGWAASPLDEGTRKVISDGMSILFESGDMLSRHLAT